MRQALHASTGSYLEELETEWAETYEGRTGVALAAFATQDALWMLGALALTGAAISRRRRFNQRLVEMEAEEDLVDEWVEELSRRRSGAAAQ